MWKIKIAKQRILISAAAVLVIGLSIISYGGLRGVSGDDSQPAEIELITLRPAGFEPAEITRPKGSFVLFVDDRSGKEESSLVLLRANNERLRAINLHRSSSEWNGVIDLPPGSYVLQHAGNSQLRCQITILP